MLLHAKLLAKLGSVYYGLTMQFLRDNQLYNLTNCQRLYATGDDIFKVAKQLIRLGVHLALNIETFNLLLEYSEHAYQVTEGILWLVQNNLDSPECFNQIESQPQNAEKVTRALCKLERSGILDQQTRQFVTLFGACALRVARALCYLENSSELEYVDFMQSTERLEQVPYLSLIVYYLSRTQQMGVANYSLVMQHPELAEPMCGILITLSKANLADSLNIAMLMQQYQSGVSLHQMTAALADSHILNQVTFSTILARPDPLVATAMRALSRERSLDQSTLAMLLYNPLDSIWYAAKQGAEFSSSDKVAKSYFKIRLVAAMLARISGKLQENATSVFILRCVPYVLIDIAAKCQFARAAIPQQQSIALARQVFFYHMGRNKALSLYKKDAHITLQS